MYRRYQCRLKYYNTTTRRTIMLKWIGIAFVGAIIWAIATGNMGGAQSATKNYVDVRSGK
jgi:hypothetical protein